jgi:peptidoglycan/xylan/chitin deacetylase (PgdA/CDA1 family)
MEPERRYALAALLDALALDPAEYEERAARQVPPEDLDEVFRALTLAREVEAPCDEHGRPKPPADAPAPLVARLAAKLGRALGAGRPEYAGGERFLVALTHDVDSLSAGGLYRTIRKLVAGAIVHPTSADARRRRREGRAYALDLIERRDPVFPLADILAAESEHGFDSTWYFLALQEDPHDGTPQRYRPALRRAVEAAAEAGLEIGLHASYRAREQPGGIAVEAELLAQATGIRPQGLRHHYLRSDPVRLAGEVRRAGLEYDTSLGWPSLPGLRAGTPFPYRLWDAERREPGAWELPLVVMDATLAERHYLALDAEAAFERSVAALAPLVEHGGAGALLWHPPSHHPRLSGGYDRVYRRLLTWIVEGGGYAGSALEVLKRWRSRRVAAG